MIGNRETQADEDTHDTVDSDTLVLDELVRQGPGESDDGPLGRGVVDQLGVTDEGYTRDRIEWQEHEHGGTWDEVR